MRGDIGVDCWAFSPLPRNRHSGDPRGIFCSILMERSVVGSSRMHLLNTGLRKKRVENGVTYVGDKKRGVFDENVKR